MLRILHKFSFQIQLFLRHRNQLPISGEFPLQALMPMVRELACQKIPPFMHRALGQQIISLRSV